MAKRKKVDAAAARREQEAAAERLRRETFAAVRKREWREWSGRQDKILNEQAARYGLPIGEAVINLPAVVRWLHEFLAENSRRLAGVDSDDPAVAGQTSAALERLREAKASREEIMLARDRTQYLPRVLVHDAHGRIGARLRQAGEAIQRQYGPGAQKILNDALDDAQREVDRLCGAADAEPHE